MVRGGRWATIRRLRSTARQATPLRQTVLFFRPASIQRQHWFWSVQHLFPCWHSPAWHHRDHLGCILTHLSGTPKEPEERHVPFTIQLYQFPFLESPLLPAADMGKTGSSIYFFLPTLSLPQMAKMETLALPHPPKCPACVMGTYTNTLNPPFFSFSKLTYHK